MSAIVPALTRADRRGYLLVLAGTVFWSTSGTIMKIILQRYDILPWTLAVWRDILTFLGLLVITALLGAGRLRVARRDLPQLAAMGAFGIGSFHVLWAQSVVLNPVAIATVLSYTAPAFVVLASWVLWQQRPSRRQATALALTLLGCVLVTEAYDLAHVRLNRLGLVVGLATGVTYGSYTLFGKPALERYGSWTVVTYAFGFGALTLLVSRPGAAVALFSAPWQAWAWILLLVCLSTITGFAAYTSGLRQMSAGSASIITTLEPALAAMWAFTFLGEALSPIQIAGGLLVLWGVVVLRRRRKQRPDKVLT